MAKMKGDMMCPAPVCGPKCIVMGLLAAAFAAGGLWMIVAAVLKQSSLMPTSNVLLWYFGGFVLWCIAKCMKMKACPMCRGGM
jgi:hypothetical protein